MPHLRLARSALPHAITGKYFLEARYDRRKGMQSKDRVSITSLHDDYAGAPSILGMAPLKAWLTEAAARAAIDHFRLWVDEGRRVQTTSAAAARLPTPFDNGLLPDRYSNRHAVGTKVSVAFGISGGMVGIVLIHVNIVTCFSRLEKFLPLFRVRKYGRKTRGYRRAFRDGRPNSQADVERLVKAYKSHRSVEVFDKAFCRLE